MSSGEKKHAGVMLYWIFCIILCAVTFLEWVLFKKKEDWRLVAEILIPLLLFMSFVKFTMVVGWYMHLRYDHNLLKYVFIASLIMGAGTGIGLCILM